jgi:serine/threonine protein kinase
MQYERSQPPYLADVGSARFFGPRENMLLGLGFTGSRPYAAPELSGAGSIDGRADIYSLAVTMLDMVQGLPDNEHEDRHYDARTVMIPVSRAEQPEWDAIDIHRATINRLQKIRDEKLRAVLAQALSADPDDRFEDMIEFQQKLSSLLPDHSGRE